MTEPRATTGDGSAILFGPFRLVTTRRKLVPLEVFNPNAPEANTAKLSLLRLRIEFVTLQKKHIDAVMVGNILLAHVLVGKIHDVQVEVMKEVSSEVGNIADTWARSLSHNRYLDTPRLVQDMEVREFGDLSKRVDRLRALDYPGNAPASAPAEVSSLAFGK